MHVVNGARLLRAHSCLNMSSVAKSRYPALALLLAALSLSCAAQSAAGPSAADAKPSLQELQSEIHELKSMVLQLQQETVASREEISRLREEMATERTGNPGAPAVDEQSPVATEQRLQHLEEDQQLLSGKLDTQYQTKVESASKYRVRLSGIVLFNLFGNSGPTDNQDVPTWATPPTAAGVPSGSIGGTLRQSIIGLEAFGPDLWGAHTSANVNFDFGGGFPSVYNGVDSGLVRLRTAAVRLDWQDTSVVAGQDILFISPLAPTSFASLIYPALSYAGNLWAWTPQLRVEHRFRLANGSTVTLAGGFLDPVTGEEPANSYFRLANAAEQTRQPGYAGRVAYSHPMFGQTFTIGAAGYYSHQNWGFDRIINGWAGMMDANLPLGRKFALSGSFYRGQAIGGFGAALGRSVDFNGSLSDPATEVQPINSVGGWAQLKYRLTPKLELNGAFGQDNPFASDVRYFGDQSESYAPFYLTRNRSAFGNVIFRPRSDLLFAAEYRRLRTFTIYDNSYEAGQVNMSVGVLF